jgi:hypothetical protein
MTTWSRAIISAFVVFAASASWAGDIITPALSVSSSTADNLWCAVVNAGTKTATDVTISIHDGGAGATTETDTFSAIGGGAARSIVETSLPGSGVFYCQVSGISKGKARVTFCPRDANDHCTFAVTVP